MIDLMFSLWLFEILEKSVGVYSWYLIKFKINLLFSFVTNINLWRANWVK